MNLRRHPKADRVRHTLLGIPPSVLLNEYGEKIVYLRGEMQRALDALEQDGNVVAASRSLRRALDERWWK